MFGWIDTYLSFHTFEYLVVFFHVISFVIYNKFSGNDLKNGLSTFKAILELVGRKHTLNRYFCKLGTCILTNSGAKKIILLTF